MGKGGIGVLLSEQQSGGDHDHHELGLLGSVLLSRRSVDVSTSTTFYLRSLDAASKGSKGGDVGFFPPTLTPALPFPTPIPPFSASSSSPSTSALFVPGAGFNRIPRPEDGEGYKI